MRSVETGIDVIGDIAILKLGPDLNDDLARLVAGAILGSMRNVKAVFDQDGGIEGDYRLRRLRHLAGEDRTLTVHKENGLRFKVDVGKTYFSPRLSTERARIAEIVSDGEKILNMFAGVGPYSVTLARRRRCVVVSNELNRDAYQLHLENNKLNKVSAQVVTLNEDAENLGQVLSGERGFDRVLMPHPSQADQYLLEGRSLISDRGGWIHYYRHASGASPEEAQVNVTREVERILGSSFDVVKPRRVREVGPRYIEIVADIHLAPR